MCSSRRTSVGKPAWTIVISVRPSRGSKLNSIEVSKLEPSSRVSVVVSRIRRGRVDRLEHVAVVVELVARGAERDRPHAADAQVAARIDDPPGRVGPIELALARGAGERVEDALGRGGDQPLEPEVEAHCPSSTNAAKRSSRPSQAAR